VRALAVLAGLCACGRIDFAARDDAAIAIDAPGTAIRLVQVTPAKSVTTSSKVSTSFARPTVVGDTIIAFAWSWSDSSSILGPTAVTDDTGTTYTRAVMLATPVGMCGGGDDVVAIYFDEVVTPASTLTLTPSGAPQQFLGLVAVEWAGVTALDQTATLLTGASPSPYVFGSGTTATTVADAELVAALGAPCGGVSVPLTWTELQGFTMRAIETDPVSHQPAFAGDKLVATSGAYFDQWQVTYSSGQDLPAVGTIATFR
jgi:hypothetical protein